MKMLAAEDPRPALRLMAATSVLSSILPQVKSLARFEALVAIETEQLFENDPDLRLAALIPDDPKQAADLAERLRLPNNVRDRIVDAVGKSPRIVSWMSPREARRAVYGLGVRAFSDRIKLAWAGSGRDSTAPQWRALLALAETWNPPAFPLSGEEVMQAGVPKGPMVGEVMREIEIWWIDQDFIEDKFSAIERLKAVAQGMVY
jgi:poly(A) polymerase